VLDRQLQDTIYQFEHKTGVVEKIDTDSAQLARALAPGVPIVISTIHKFGYTTYKPFLCFAFASHSPSIRARKSANLVGNSSRRKPGAIAQENEQREE